MGFGSTLHDKPARFQAGFQELGQGTWAYLQPNGSLGESNAGLVCDGEHVLFIDSLWDNRLTSKMLSDARSLVDASPEVLFNTHSDGDHVWGNQQFREARIISTRAAAELMRLDPPRSLRRIQRGGRALGAVGALPLPLIGRREYGNLPRLPLRHMGDEMAPFDWSDIELTLPQETFDGRTSIEIGSRRIELIEVGPAHTIGDAVAWIPDEKVCFAADILFIGVTPIMWAGPVSSWIASLETISELGAKKLVPGHGPVGNQTDVDTMRDYFTWVLEEGVSQLAAGVSPAKAAGKLLLSEEFEGLPWAAWDDPTRLVVTLSTEAFRRRGGIGQFGGRRRARAIAQLQLASTALERKRAKSIHSVTP